MSTGMASIDEIRDAIETAKDNGCQHIALFHCISSYPAPINESNIKAIQKLKQEFDVEVGLSDHTIGNVASMAAVSLGAEIIEIHVTLNKNIIIFAFQANIYAIIFAKILNIKIITRSNSSPSGWSKNPFKKIKI